MLIWQIPNITEHKIKGTETIIMPQKANNAAGVAESQIALTIHLRFANTAQPNKYKNNNTPITITYISNAFLNQKPKKVYGT